MRLWTLHPKNLDRQGLLALWREGLLAQAVLQGKTKGYRNHPQLIRFRQHPDPEQAIAHYLQAVREESVGRGYNFNASKISPSGEAAQIPATSGQLAYETEHLLRKLKERSPDEYERVSKYKRLDPHPLFLIIPGEIEEWEKV